MLVYIIFMYENQISTLCFYSQNGGKIMLTWQAALLDEARFTSVSVFVCSDCDSWGLSIMEVSTFVLYNVKETAIYIYIYIYLGKRSAWARRKGKLVDLLVSNKVDQFWKIHASFLAYKDQMKSLWGSINGVLSHYSGSWLQDRTVVLTPLSWCWQRGGQKRMGLSGNKEKMLQICLGLGPTKHINLNCRDGRRWTIMTTGSRNVPTLDVSRYDQIKSGHDSLLWRKGVGCIDQVGRKVELWVDHWVT